MDLITVFQTSPLFFNCVVILSGLLVGSFLNVVIHRLPMMMEREWRRECSLLLDVEQEGQKPEPYNLIVPRSACPHCHHRITALENIPVISYLLLGGKCRNCKTPISLRYPIIEVSSGLIAAILAIHFGPSLQLIPALLFSWSLLALSIIDYDHKLLPDSITLPFLWLGIICNMFGLYTDIYSGLFGVIFGYLVLWGVYMLFKLLTGKEGMGYGDFKLLAMLGAWLGWQFLPLIIIISSLLGSIIGGALILFRSHSRTQPIPFGPYLALAGFIALVYGQELIRLYLDWAVS